MNSKMAGDELGQAANSDAGKWHWRCALASSLNVVNKKLFNFDVELHSELFYESGCTDCVWTYQSG